MVTVHSSLLQRHYVAHPISLAAFFCAGAIVVIVIIPFLIAYASYSFWLKENTYREQPTVSFRHELMYSIQDSSNYNFFTTFPEANALDSGHLNVPIIQSAGLDDNGDGKIDRFRFNITSRLTSGQTVQKVDLLLFFNYILQDRVHMSMTSAAHVSYSAGLPGSQLVVDGWLRLKQRKPLVVRSDYRTVYNTAIVSGFTSDDYRMHTILSNYLDRNETTMLEDQYPVWIGNAGGGISEFTLSATIRIPFEIVHYVPPFSETMKWAWVQYLSILIPVAWIAHMIMTFAYKNQIFETRTVTDIPIIKPHQM
eukprot:GILJ01007370.1.p1 GENE.GILJ01007370.1~~GILJ01007370.1.p1  ORF type:complete len:309 (+),score=23.70 GILJ01007370.1:33-959(+)